MLPNADHEENHLDAFSSALVDFINSLPKGKGKRNFIDQCRVVGPAYTLLEHDRIQSRIEADVQARKKLSNPVQKAFLRISKALLAYSSFLDQIGQLMSIL